MREQIGGKYDIWFQETRISGLPFDKSIKQRGKESPCLFHLMMRSVFRTLQEEWKVLRMGVKTNNSGGRQEQDRVSHMIFTDNCYLFNSKEEILKMVGDVVEELKKRGMEWKEDQMDLISWGFCKDLRLAHRRWREEKRDQRSGSLEGHGSAHHERSGLYERFEISNEQGGHCLMDGHAVSTPTRNRRIDSSARVDTLAQVWLSKSQAHMYAPT